MSIMTTAPEIPATIYAAVAFQMAVNLTARLRQLNLLTENDRIDLFNNIAAGLNPAADPGVKAMKELLWAISGQKPS